MRKVNAVALNDSPKKLDKFPFVCYTKKSRERQELGVNHSCMMNNHQRKQRAVICDDGLLL